MVSSLCDIIVFPRTMGEIHLGFIYNLYNIYAICYHGNHLVCLREQNGFITLLYLLDIIL